MKTLYLIRGVPGSGKTTLAQTLAHLSWLETGVVYSADDYFMVSGEYQFDPTKLKQAHASCQRIVRSEMRDFHGDNIFVANTFTQEWEMKPYLDVAEEYGYRVFSIIVENRHGGKNVHGCPDDKVEQMKNRFEVVL